MPSRRLPAKPRRLTHIPSLVSGLIDDAAILLLLLSAPPAEIEERKTFVHSALSPAPPTYSSRPTHAYFMKGRHRQQRPSVRPSVRVNCPSVCLSVCLYVAVPVATDAAAVAT